jgi:hypothetical protein
MLYFLALVPATILTIAGYGALFLAHRSEGAFKSFGKYLGFWAFTLAVLIVLGAIVAAARGDTLHGMRMYGCAGAEPMGQCPYMRSWRHPPPGDGARGMPGMPPAPPESPEGTPPK